MSFLMADWPAPNNVTALSTLRTPGHSETPYDSNNLALHVGDESSKVLANRAALNQALNFKKEPIWLEQTHSTDCVVVEESKNRQGDASITRQTNQPLAILTADCLPIVLCNKQGSEIAAVHAGWRGLLNGIVENTLKTMHSNPADLMAWIGPAICSSCFEVGPEVLDAFQSKHTFANAHFLPKKEKWLADLPSLAEKMLMYLGIKAIFKSNICTFEQKKSFYSYRRESQTGRIATLIWLN